MKTKSIITTLLTIFCLSIQAQTKQCVITSIVLNKMPSLNSKGSNWDMTSGPDVYCKISTQADEIYKSGTSTDLDLSSLPVTFKKDLPITLPYLNQKYSIRFYDYDNGIKDDEYIGGYSFNPKDYPAFPSSIKLYNDESDLSITLTVAWE